MKDYFKSLERGLGFGTGLLILLALAFGVYAFVEPSSGPSTDYFFDSNSPLISNNTLQFSGYTSAVNGNRGNWTQAINECDSLYTGSRPATQEDLMKLGPNYDFAYEVWVFPETFPSTTGTTCFYWTSTGHNGLTVDQDGTQNTRSCAGGYRFACVKGN